jgi:UDP-N-acetylmuramate--alanine ligase
MAGVNLKKKFYFVGIKGSGMSSLAHILFDLGNEVTGSDIEDYVFTEQGLNDKNIEIKPFNQENITGEHTYIIGNAFNSSNNEEVSKILKSKYDSYFYHDYLKEMSIEKRSIGVAGVHGKTSTTSLLSYLLEQTVGTSYLIGDGNGKGDSTSKYFVFEACEYKNHFLNYKPYYGIITNIDLDHPDFFKSEEQVIRSFAEYAKNVRHKLLIFGDDNKYKKLILREDKKLLTYGFLENNVFQARNIIQKEEGFKYDFYYKGAFVETIEMPLYGKHNILNSLAAVGILYLENVSLSKISELAKEYKGAKRRFQVEEYKGYTWINDYAHHPIEITATIEATKQKYPNKKIVAIFQPHTYTRTLMFEKEFKESLSNADVVYGCEIFGSARENQGGITIKDLMENIPNSNVLTDENIVDLKNHKDDILLFMGAGDIEKYIVEFKRKL